MQEPRPARHVSVARLGVPQDLVGWPRPGGKPGQPVVLGRAADVPVGMAICYDLRFPEAARVCALDGADLIGADYFVAGQPFKQKASLPLGGGGRL